MNAFKKSYLNTLLLHSCYATVAIGSAIYDILKVSLKGSYKIVVKESKRKLTGEFNHVKIEIDNKK